jgi:N-succinyldiaminopimelate aminotransferase
MSNETFRKVPRTGVVYVVQEASKLGFYRGNPEWVNFGQGQPQTDFIKNGVERIHNIPVVDADNEYAPVSGLPDLREAIANYYNETFRKGKKSKYTAKNVSVVSGGRLALARLAASLGNINLGHFVPDYTAYEELLSTFNRFNPIPILLDPEKGYSFTTEDLRREVQGRGLGAVLVSNPCNPTGKTIKGKSLEEWVSTGRDFDCYMLMDEFYSSYVYSGMRLDETLSAAKYVEDVNEDPVVLLDGATKNWRYPGWRIAWIVGPEHVIESVTSAGSFLDGGACRPAQRAIVPLLDPAKMQQETAALKANFREKRRIMLDGLQKLGVTFEREPDGAFYAWGNVSALPEGLNTGMDFFRAALQEQVIVVPGEFFDVNPGKRRGKASSRFSQHLRFSYGPEISTIKEGIKRLQKVVDNHIKA